MINRSESGEESRSNALIFTYLSVEKTIITVTWCPQFPAGLLLAHGVSRGPQSPWKVWMVWDCGMLALTQCSAEEWHGRSTEAPRYSLCSRIGKPVGRAKVKKTTRQDVMFEW